MSFAEECKSAGLNLDEPRRPREKDYGVEEGWDRWGSKSFELSSASASILGFEHRGRVSLTFNELPIGENAMRRR